MRETFIIAGPLVHSRSWDKITIIQDGVIAVDKGKIVACDTKEKLPAIQALLKVADEDVIQLREDQFLMPGLIDTHIHASQYPNAGLGLDKNLLEWLDTYTFPLETKYSDVSLAHNVYTTVVKRTLGNGTTTACYFATIHLKSSQILAEICGELGQRAFVGKVNMNQNHPEYYGETSENSYQDTVAFVDNILAMKNPLVKPVITPRFAVSCDMTLMTRLGALAAQRNVNIQTHISEDKGEVELVHQLYPDSKNYVDVYDKANLLTKKTILAHGVYLEDAELPVLVQRGSAISHCPLSNTSLQSGNCNVKRLVAAGVKVGLGTDVSGGYSPSVLDAMRSCIGVSINVGFADEAQKPALNFNHAFYLATLGGAEALALGDRIGNFIVGKEFDALVISTKIPNSPIDVLPVVQDYSTTDLVQKFIYNGDDRNITQVFVQGKLVKNSDTLSNQFSDNVKSYVLFSQ